MLDLKKMEEKLDAVLAKETDESLTNWLINQRKQNQMDNEKENQKTNKNDANSRFLFSPENHWANKKPHQEIPEGRKGEHSIHNTSNRSQQ